MIFTLLNICFILKIIIINIIKMKIISFDVGIKNLAYCIFEIGIQSSEKIKYNIDFIPNDISNIQIIEWDVIPIISPQYKAKNVSLQNIGNNFFSILISKPSMTNVDYVLIENQIGPKNIRMKCVQSILMQTYMCILGCINENNIQFISSNQKLDYFLEKKKRTYQERKKESIVLMNQFLETKWLSVWHTHFIKHKKKDDLADCFLQGYSWLLLEYGYLQIN